MYFTARGMPPPALAPGETLLVNGEDMSYERLLEEFDHPYETLGPSSLSRLPQHEGHPWVQGCASCGCTDQETKYAERRDGGWVCIGCKVNIFVEMKRGSASHSSDDDEPPTPPRLQSWFLGALRGLKQRYDDAARAKAVAAAEDSFAVPEPPRPAVQKKKKTGGKKGKKKRGGGKENKA